MSQDEDNSKTHYRKTSLYYGLLLEYTTDVSELKWAVKAAHMQQDPVVAVEILAREIIDYAGNFPITHWQIACELASEAIQAIHRREHE